MSHQSRILMFQTLVSVITLVTTLSTSKPARAQQAYFMSLGNLPGDEFGTTPLDISGDGSIVVGYSATAAGAYHGFRWTRETGTVELPGTVFAMRISNDGTTIAGTNGLVPFRWTKETGTVLLPHITDAGPIGITADGSKIAFYSNVWSETGGMVGSPNGMRIADISGDGLTFAGWGGAGWTPQVGYIWSQADGPTELGPSLPGGTKLTDPGKFSADGKVVIGTSVTPGSPRDRFKAARWDQQTGLTDLGFEPDGANSAGFGDRFGVSGDGSVVTGGSSKAWIWRHPSGIEWLNDVLGTELGLASQLTGWRLFNAIAISNDGRTIVGSGSNPAGKDEAWIAYLGTPVPEPSTLLLAAVALVPFACRRRTASNCTSTGCSCLTVVLLVGTLICASTAQAAIITGPVTNPSNGNKYYLLTQNNWTGSEAEAVGLGGHLATINDAAENSWVTATFSNFGGVSRALWIGLNDAAVEGSFVWVSGQPVGYTNWGPSEPTNTDRIEDWVHIFPPNESRFPKWNDAPNASNSFDYVFHGVVEIAAVPEPSTLVLAALALVPLAWRRRRRRSRLHCVA